jgi:hypothetical protein
VHSLLIVNLLIKKGLKHKNKKSGLLVFDQGNTNYGSGKENWCGSGSDAFRFMFMARLKKYDMRTNLLRARVGCPRNKQTKFSVRTETNRNSTCFGLFSVCFAKPINYFFGLFRFVSVFRIHNETTETNISVSKQTEKNLQFF